MEQPAHSISHPERLCLSGKKSDTRDSRSKSIKRVELFPNFPIKNGRLSTDSMLPSAEFLKKFAKSKRMEINQKASEMVKDQKAMYEMIYPSVGQLVTIYVLKPHRIKELTKAPKIFFKTPPEVIIPSPNVATCSLLTIEDRFDTLFGLSCLHSVQLVLSQSAPFPAHEYDQVTLFIKHHWDVQQYLWPIHEDLVGMVRKWKLEYLTIHKLQSLFAKLLKSRSGEHPMFLSPITISTDFLERRCLFIEDSSKQALKVVSGGQFHPLLDPEFRLQPIPSFDMLTFSFSHTDLQRYQAFLKDEMATDSEFQFLEDSISFTRSVKMMQADLKANTGAAQNRRFDTEINELGGDTQLESSQIGKGLEAAKKNGETQSTCISVNSKPLTFLTLSMSVFPSVQRGDLVSILGFHSIKNRKIEHDDVYQPAYRKKFKGLVDSEFLNRNLSLGVCEIKSYQPCIFTYKGNTSEGSSGSPILDQDLRVVGINFGCYHDVQEEHPPDNIPKIDKKLTAKKINNKPASIHVPDEPSNSIAVSASSVEIDSSMNQTLQVKSKRGNKTDQLLNFDIEIEEPGALIHQTTLKNRNLAVSTNHPAFRAWLKDWYDHCVKLASIPKDWDDVSNSSVVTLGRVSADIPVKGSKSGTSVPRVLTQLKAGGYIPVHAQKTKYKPSSRSISKIHSTKRKY